MRLVLVVHAVVGALWFGAMVYSLFVVQPRLPRMVSADRVEDAQRELAAGNRWPVVGLIGVLWISGGVLALGSWGLFALVKALLLGAASALFWWVSWRAWPRRVFALPDELPALQRQFRQVALLMLALVGAAFGLSMIR